MSSTSTVTSSVEQLDRQLNEQILTGDILGAFERFYAENVVMQENTEPAFEGKTTNRKREQDFMNSVEQFHGAKLLGSAVNGNRSYSEWEYDATLKDGKRLLITQVAVRQWRDGQVAHERFYYSK